MHSRDVAYYQERAAAERRLAEDAASPEAAAAHEELARNYETLIANAGQPPKLAVVRTRG